MARGEAAEAARAAARRRSLTEILQDAVRLNEQACLFLSQRKWDIVWPRTQETATAASLALICWPLELGDARDSLLRVQRLASSMASAALRTGGGTPVLRDVTRMSQARDAWPSC